MWKEGTGTESTTTVSMLEEGFLGWWWWGLNVGPSRNCRKFPAKPMHGTCNRLRFPKIAEEEERRKMEVAMQCNHACACAQLGHVGGVWVEGSKGV